MVGARRDEPGCGEAVEGGKALQSRTGILPGSGEGWTQEISVQLPVLLVSGDWKQWLDWLIRRKGAWTSRRDGRDAVCETCGPPMVRADAGRRDSRRSVSTPAFTSVWEEETWDALPCPSRSRTDIERWSRSLPGCCVPACGFSEGVQASQRRALPDKPTDVTADVSGRRPKGDRSSGREQGAWFLPGDQCSRAPSA